MKTKELTLSDRTQIQSLVELHYSQTHIANHLDVHKSTISRELHRGRDSLGAYRAEYADKQACKRIQSRKAGKRKLITNPELQSVVHEKLQLKWSPDQISHWLKTTYTGTTMHISHEAIYQYIYVLPRGKLKASLIKGLRQERTYRRTKHKRSSENEKRGKIQDMLSIHERPKEVELRTIPGHWEGDLIMGKYRSSALLTLVERTTRYTLIILLGKDKSATAVREAMQERLTTLPQHLIKSLTYDQGKEMSQHRRFSVDSGITVYFCDPASPWQRGTNENTNGLIRQYFPKGTDFRKVSAEQVQQVEDSLNGRPRKVLDYRFPKEVFYDLVAIDC